MKLIHFTVAALCLTGIMLLATCKKETNPPVAGFSHDPLTGNRLTVFQFDASLSSDASDQDSTLRFRWDWDSDGTWDTEFSTGTVVYNRFYAPGEYNVRMEVKNSAGLVSSTSQTLTVSEGNDDTFTDARDGKVYGYVTIDNQIWMKENLSYLPFVNNSNANPTSSQYYVYGNVQNTVSAAKAVKNYGTYGVLYNWLAAQTACPTGWHLPDSLEWHNLSDYLGDNAIPKMKETGTAHWFTISDPPATNESGFTALPGGFYEGSSYKDLQEVANFWSSTGSTYAFNARYIRMNIAGIDVDENYFTKANGCSVRCIKN
jgi:uncharacterized protein (TIGR02145 family)